MKRIEVYHKNRIYSLTTDGDFRKEDNDTTRSVISKIKKRLPNDNYTAFLIFFSGFESFKTKAIEKFLKRYQIQRIYVFFEDVFRLWDTNLLYNDNFNIPEIEILKKISRKNKKLDITIFHCEKNCTAVEKRYGLKLHYFDWFLSDTCENNIDAQLENIDNIKPNINLEKKISCFNLRPDWHRTFLGLLLSAQENCNVTLNYTISKSEYQNQQNLPYKKFSDKIKKLIDESYDNLDYSKVLFDIAYKKIKKTGTVELDGTKQWNNLGEIQKSFLNVATETRFYSPMQYITEKAIKPIIVKRPFILAAPPYSLDLLRDLGFKTFNKWWDESYDKIEDHNHRLERIHEICTEILSYDWNILKNMLIDMDDVLEHNRHHLKKVQGKMLNYINL